MIVAISGSLRESSLNSAALRVVARAAARSGIDVRVEQSPRRLPHFDADLEGCPPESVQSFRAACARATGVLLAVPEYAFGIPGTLKNALDWTVGSGSLSRKPTAVLSVAPQGRGAHVRAALESVLSALDAEVSWHRVPVHPALLDQGEIRDGEVERELVAVAVALAARAHTRSDGADPALMRSR